MSDKWKVQVFGKRGAKEWEISVVKESNTHGQQSWGWFGPDKIRISDNGGPYHHAIPGYLFDQQIELAQRVCDRLNNGESIA